MGRVSSGQVSRKQLGHPRAAALTGWGWAEVLEGGRMDKGTH